MLLLQSSGCISAPKLSNSDAGHTTDLHLWQVVVNGQKFNPRGSIPIREWGTTAVYGCHPHCTARFYEGMRAYDMANALEHRVEDTIAATIEKVVVICWALHVQPKTLPPIHPPPVAAHDISQEVFVGGP